MEKNTKSFLKRTSGEEVESGVEEQENINFNANKAKESAGIPKKLWKELSVEFPKSKLGKSCKESAITSFMAGFYVGWVEKTKKITKVKSI